MSREPAAERRRRSSEVFDRREQAYPKVAIELSYSTDIQLLVAVILSAQCTDARVNLVTPRLFARFPTVQDFAKATPEEIEPYVKTCGLFRAKAKAIAAASRAIVLNHGGELPRQRTLLHALPGVGPKTAGVVTIHLEGGEPAFPVDTHVGRLARRLGFSSKAKPDDVERDLQRLLPPERWGVAHQLLVRHGRRCCTARAPACPRCPVSTHCPKRGIVEPSA
ncbi:MAG: endonuclease III [Deltaproteobacteria bacterium]